MITQWNYADFVGLQASAEAIMTTDSYAVSLFSISPFVLFLLASSCIIALFESRSSDTKSQTLAGMERYVTDEDEVS
jgi:hypothetical protein